MQFGACCIYVQLNRQCCETDGTVMLKKKDKMHATYIAYIYLQSKKLLFAYASLTSSKRQQELDCLIEL